MKFVFGLGFFLFMIFLPGFTQKDQLSFSIPTFNGLSAAHAYPGRETVIACSPGSQKNKEEKDCADTMLSHIVKKQFYPTPDSMEEAFPNDNKKAAGVLKNGVLTLNLEARDGAWFPETHEGKSIHVFAFAEVGKPIQVPGPQVRVPEGTIIKAAIHNRLTTPLVLHGFCSRPADIADSVTIAPGNTYETSFKAGKRGTYFYRASASDSLSDDGLPFFSDSQLIGAFVIDPNGFVIDPKERVIMIGLWNDTTNGPTGGGEELALNGRSWPFTESMTYMQNQVVNWKLINASNQSHPMHLHGFFFTVKSRGNTYRDSIYEKQNQSKEVTELLHPGETISLRWIPERAGNWLFHCHTLVHIMPGSFLRKTPEMDSMNMNDPALHVRDGMGGLIMGLHVLPSKKGAASIAVKKMRERKLTLIVKEIPKYYDTLDGKGFILKEEGQPDDEKGSIPGPAIILNRGEPVAIKIINRLKEATTIHWHGLEIESYFDGVAGWGNKGKLLAPLIQPGDSFVVHLVPPRSGTYIYHTHMHNFQLLEGMSGPLIVKEPGQKFDTAVNKIFHFTQGGKEVEDFILFLNGKKDPDTMYLKTGTTYRFRVINITSLVPRFNISLMFNGSPVSWRIIAEDGADLPTGLRTVQPALKYTVSIGETRDFEFHPDKEGDYFFEGRFADGKLIFSKLIRVKRSD